MTEVTDEILDAVSEAIRPELSNVSTIARRARVSYSDAYSAVQWLESHRFIVGEGNGAWRKYRARRWGE